MRPFLTLHHPANARRYYAAGLWRDDTFYTLLARNAAERPDAPALRDGRCRLTFAETKAWADGIAADLVGLGLAGGDRVCLWMSSRAEAVAMFLACSRQGFACNPSLHRTHTCEEIARLVDWLQARVLVTEAQWGADRDRGDLAAQLKSVGSLQKVFT